MLPIDYLWSPAKSSGMGQKHLKTTCRFKAQTLSWGPQQYTEFTRGLAANITLIFLLLLLILCIHHEAVRRPVRAAPNAITDKRNVSTCASQSNGRIHLLSPIPVHRNPDFTHSHKPSFHQADGRFTTRSRCLEARDSDFFNCSEIWQVPRQQHCLDAYQILEPSDHFDRPSLPYGVTWPHWDDVGKLLQCFDNFRDGSI